MNRMNVCIAVLTRGYTNKQGYTNLIKRNKQIVLYLVNKSIDIVIFHEGNITEDHQIFIKNETPELKIIFINISSIAFKAEKKDIVVTDAHSFGLGYRHMCSFWFVNFWDVVTEYDKMIRIDEDCFIDSNIDTLFSQLDEYIFITGTIQNDELFATMGLHDFSLDFLKTHNCTYATENAQIPNGPYTNVIGFSLNKIRENRIFQEYKDIVDKQNLIYERRWGDHSLWGEVIHYIFGKHTLKVDTTLRYFHESHSMYVNPECVLSVKNFCIPTMEKIIIHVYKFGSFGFADFLRGIYLVSKLAKENGYIYKIAMNHPISEFFNIDTTPYETTISNDYALLRKQIQQNIQYIVLESNYNDWCDPSPQNTIQHYLIPKPQFQLEVLEKMKKLKLRHKQFVVLHVRVGDTDTECNNMILLRIKRSISLAKISRLPILFLCSKSCVLNKFTDYPGIVQTGWIPCHIGIDTAPITQLKQSLIEFYLMQYSKKIYGMSDGGFGKRISGFSYWAAKMFHVEYTHI